MHLPAKEVIFWSYGENRARSISHPYWTTTPRCYRRAVRYFHRITGLESYDRSNAAMSRSVASTDPAFLQCN